MWKEKKSLFAIEYDLEYNGKGLARLCSTIFCERIMRKNVASSVGVEKKSNLWFTKKKKNTDCADIIKTKDEKIQKF